MARPYAARTGEERSHHGDDLRRLRAIWRNLADCADRRFAVAGLLFDYLLMNDWMRRLCSAGDPSVIGGIPAHNFQNQKCNANQEQEQAR